MAQPKRPEIKEKDLQGLKFFKRLIPILEGLHDQGTDRDRELGASRGAPLNDPIE